MAVILNSNCQHVRHRSSIHVRHCCVCMCLAECGMPPILLYIVTIASTGLCKSVSGWHGIVIHLLWVLKHHTQPGHETGINITCFTIWHLIAECISARLWIEDLFSQSMYVRTYLVGSCSGMSHGMSLHTIGIGIGHMCVTQSDTFRYARLRSWMQRGHRGLDTTNTKQLILQQM